MRCRSHRFSRFPIFFAVLFATVSVAGCASRGDVTAPADRFHVQELEIVFADEAELFLPDEAVAFAKSNGVSKPTTMPIGERGGGDEIEEFEAQTEAYEQFVKSSKAREHYEDWIAKTLRSHLTEHVEVGDPGSDVDLRVRVLRYVPNSGITINDVIAQASLVNVQNGATARQEVVGIDGKPTKQSLAISAASGAFFGGAIGLATSTSNADVTDDAPAKALVAEIARLMLRQ